MQALPTPVTPDMQMHDRNPIGLVTSVGDKALSVMTIMLMIGQAVSQERLMSLTDSSFVSLPLCF